MNHYVWYDIVMDIKAFSLFLIKIVLRERLKPHLDKEVLCVPAVPWL